MRGPLYIFHCPIHSLAAKGPTHLRIEATARIFRKVRDTITEDDLLIDEDKTQVEKELEETKKEKALLEEQLSAMDAQMKEILTVVSGLTERAATGR